jgi:hypothetical protein
MQPISNGADAQKVMVCAVLQVNQSFFDESRGGGPHVSPVSGVRIE